MNPATTEGMARQHAATGDPGQPPRPALGSRAVLADADPLLVAVAVAFAVVNGANDGGTLLALSLRAAGLRVWVALVALAAMVAVAPALVGTQVATTLAVRLVDVGGAERLVVLAAVIAAVTVPVGLSRAGLPTSLTVALVGGLVGAGAANGVGVAWGLMGAVVVAAAAAPVVGGLGAFALSRLARHLVAPGGAARFLARAHRVTFAVQALAYGANDGQKMLAVGALALGLADGQARSGGAVPPAWPLLAGSALAFFVGAVLGLRRYARTVGMIIPLRRPNAVVGEAAAATAVLGTAALGAPVSMTQTVAGGLVGTGASEGQGRVRWQVTSRIAIAWMATLPLAAGAGAAAAAAIAAAG
jgi:PiT family inorganic phosphate transporter